MLYSIYYKGKERQKPTTQADQIARITGQSVEPSPEPELEDLIQENPSPEPEIPPALDPVQELIDGNTVTELRKMAKDFGIKVPSGSKERDIAELIVKETS